MLRWELREEQGIRLGSWGEREYRCRSPGLCWLLGTMSHPEGDGRHFLSLKGKCLLKPRAVPWSVEWSVRNATVALKGSWWLALSLLAYCVCVHTLRRPSDDPASQILRRDIEMVNSEKNHGVWRKLEVTESNLSHCWLLVWPFFWVCSLNCLVTEWNEVCRMEWGVGILCPP